MEAPRALRRPTSPRGTRPAGLEPAPFRSTAGCSFRLSYNLRVIRRRRETATGACRVVGVAFQTTRAPCRNGRRRITVLLVLLPFPRPSLVNQRAAREAPVLHPAVSPGGKCKTPHLALGAGGALILLPGPEGGRASRHSPVPRGSCARLRHLRLRNAHAPAVASDGRDPAPGVPAVAGKPCAMHSEVDRWLHRSVLDSRNLKFLTVNVLCRHQGRKCKIAPPMIARRILHIGVGRHRPEAVQRLVNIGTRLPGRAF